MSIGIPYARMREPETRRLRMYAISTDLLARDIRRGVVFPRAEIIEGPPQDAVLVQVSLDMEHRELLLTFEHPSFEEVCDGCLLPAENISMRAYYDVPVTNETRL